MNRQSAISWQTATSHIHDGDSGDNQALRANPVQQKAHQRWSGRLHAPNLPQPIRFAMNNNVSLLPPVAHAQDEFHSWQDPL